MQAALVAQLAERDRAVRLLDIEVFIANREAGISAGVFPQRDRLDDLRRQAAALRGEGAPERLQHLLSMGYLRLSHARCRC